tara:strand:- start:6506 stop:6721 length:216 start_codon:yes stop_codon:yes gene_type:complete
MKPFDLGYDNFTKAKAEHDFPRKYGVYAKKQYVLGWNKSYQEALQIAKTFVVEEPSKPCRIIRMIEYGKLI